MVEEEESQLDSSALLEGNVDVVVQSSRVIEVVVWWCGMVVVWWCGDVVVRWCGGVMVRWC